MRGSPLNHVLSELARYRHGFVTCADAVANLRVSGSFPLADTDRALAVLTKAFPLRTTFLARYWSPDRTGLKRPAGARRIRIPDPKAQDFLRGAFIFLAVDPAHGELALYAGGNPCGHLIRSMFWFTLPTRRITRAAPLVALVAAGWPTAVIAAQPAVAVDTAAGRVYDIAPGDLARVLTDYRGRGCGAVLRCVADAAWRSHGLRGRYDVGRGFDAILQVGLLHAVAQGPGVFILRVSPGAATPVSEMPEVQVVSQDTSPWGPVAGYVASDNVTSTKTDAPLVETPQSVSVVTRQQMDDQGVQTVSQALRYTAGVVPEAQPGR